MRAQFLSSIHDLTAADWNRVCGGDYPFLRHEFLAALEDSGSTTRKTGWQPHHLCLKQADDIQLLMPLFLKYHSYGEYVFDWGWAEAWEHHGLDYYPKLLCAIPFTPATGPRWSTAIECSEHQTEQLLKCAFQAIEEEGQRLGVSSGHWLFHPHSDSRFFQTQNHLQRIGCQYHWLNDNYRDFEDFLASFTSRKRKSLKRERRIVAEQNIELRIKEGKDISESDWYRFYQFYHLTYFKRSGRQGYLTEAFFPLIAETMKDQVMMAQASKGGEVIAAALYFKDNQALYGRYWGCLQEYDQLHFETCYYQGIDYAIQQGLKRFDPGAQGEHKIQRGFTPILTCSHHWIAEPKFCKAIAQFLLRETHQIKRYQTMACERLPFKHQTNRRLLAGIE